LSLEPEHPSDKAFTAIVVIAILRKGNLDRPRVWLQAEKMGRRALSGIEDPEALITQALA
jgi:hypothetical protein